SFAVAPFSTFFIPSTYSSLFFFSGSGPPRVLHSFPTRRSSDLPAVVIAWMFFVFSFVYGNALDAQKEYANFRLSQVLCDLNHMEDRKSTRLNSSHVSISYAVFCLKKKKQQ